MEKQPCFAIIPASSYMGRRIHHAKNVMVHSVIPYIKTRSRYFITQEDLDIFMVRNRKAHREYLWWRVKQSWPIGSSNQERLYYVLWLEEIGLMPSLKK
jgi:hypothetical protein